jgi:hypothetical protein
MYSWSAWDASWTWSLALIAATITIHAVGVVLIAVALERSKAKFLRRQPNYPVRILGGFVLFVAVALSLAMLHGIESMVWAVAYEQLGALPTPADAALYSVDSMTTRGESGLVLARQWRMMGATEAGDGMLLFGISTAFLFYVMQRLWKSDTQTPVIS